MNRIVLAADLGGTNLRVATVSESGEVISRRYLATPISKSFEDVCAAILDAARGLKDEIPPEAIVVGLGVAVPAVIDRISGKVVKAPNLSDLNGKDLASAVSLELGVPVFLENDATSAAIGESWKGASRNCSTSLCVTLGTGVGGGLIIDQHVFRGIDGTAGEVGHINVEPFGYPCGCGSNGCLEQYASAQGLLRMIDEMRVEHPNSIIAVGSGVTPNEIYEAGLKGDELAVAVFRKMGFYLGVAFAGLVNLLNPEAIVLGGGVANGWDLFAPEVERQISMRAFQQPAERVKLVRAELGDDAGVIGVARSVLSFEQKAV